jgi:hypothetical protein
LLLLLLGYLTGVGILQKLVVVLLVVGAVWWLLGPMGRPVPAIGNWEPWAQQPLIHDDVVSTSRR